MFTGERILPGGKFNITYQESLFAYEFAQQRAEGKRVLDVGSGEGYGVAYLAEKTHEVVGLDTHAGAVEEARRKYARENVAFVAGTLDSPPVAVAYAFVLREFYPGPAESIGHEYDNDKYKSVVLYRTMFGCGSGHESTRYLAAYFSRGTCWWQLTVNGLPYVWIFERLSESERPNEERDKVTDEEKFICPAARRRKWLPILGRDGYCKRVMSATQSKAKEWRVLVLAPTPFFADRGAHMHIAEQAYALQRLGLEVLIATYRLGRDIPGLRTVRTMRTPLYKKLGPGPSWHKFYVDPLLLITAWRAVKEFKPDILHAHLHEGAVLGMVLSRWFKIPMIFDVQGSLTGELIAHKFPLVAPPLDKLWYKLERFIDNRADMLVAQSTEMRVELIEQFHVPEEKIMMAYDGVNTSLFKPGERDPELVKRFGIPKDKKTIVYLGGLSPHKGVDILLGAFPRVLKKIPEAYLLLMGYPHEDEYRAKIQAMGLSAAAQVTGKVPYEEAPRYLTLGDIAVAPKRSQTEANGKIYNYMACGLPTVAFDTVVNRDILGELGVYVSGLNDAAALAERIIWLLENDSERRQLAEQVRAKAVKDYSWDNVAKRLLVAYEKAATKRVRV